MLVNVVNRVTWQRSYLADMPASCTGLWVFFVLLLQLLPESVAVICQLQATGCAGGVGWYFTSGLVTLFQVVLGVFELLPCARQIIRCMCPPLALNSALHPLLELHQSGCLSIRMLPFLSYTRQWCFLAFNLARLGPDVLHGMLLCWQLSVSAWVLLLPDS